MHDPETINYGKQSIDSDDIAAVVEVLQSPFLTQGPKVKQFEQAFANQVQVPHAVACCNGTAALHLACMALELKPGDHLWTSPISFVASANCARYCGASVDFVDINPLTANISTEALRKKLQQAEKTGTLPKILIVVHMAGNPCDMHTIYNLCQPLGIKIIEDAAHALGSCYEQEQVGGCKYSDCTTFSFHPIKSITTAEGGMITTNSKEITHRLKLLVSHGIEKEITEAKEFPDWYYEQQLLGYNYRLSELHAALGLSQLNKLAEFIRKRQIIFERYKVALAAIDLDLQKQTPDTHSAYHLAIAMFPERLRDKVYNELRAQSIFCQLHYIPIYRQPFHDIGSENYQQFSGSEQYFSRALSLPIYPTLSEEQQSYVISMLIAVAS